MNLYKYLVVITHREWTENYLEFFNSHGVQRVITTLCEGTSADAMLNLWGLEKTEKVMFQAFVRTDLQDEISNDLYSKMNIGGIGNGIAFYLPIETVGGKSALKYLTGDSEVNSKEEGKDMETTKSLIITITE